MPDRLEVMPSDKLQQDEIVREISRPLQASVVMFFVSWSTIAFVYPVVNGIWWTGVFWFVASLGLWLISRYGNLPRRRAYALYIIVGISFILSALFPLDASLRILFTRSEIAHGFLIFAGCIFLLLSVAWYTRSTMLKLQKAKNANCKSGRLDVRLRQWDLTVPMHLTSLDAYGRPLSSGKWKVGLTPVIGILLVFILRSLHINLAESPLALATAMCIVGSVIVVFAGRFFGIAFQILNWEHEVGGEILIG